jgi:hypothetical protein
MVGDGQISDTKDREFVGTAGVVNQHGRGSVHDSPAVSYRSKAKLVVHVIDEKILSVQSLVAKHVHWKQTTGCLGNEILSFERVVLVSDTRNAMNDFRHHEEHSFIFRVSTILRDHLGDERVGGKTVLVEKEDEFTVGISPRPLD